MRELNLYFEAGQLAEVEFCDGITNDLRRSVRGKSAGAYGGAGSFQWTSAVKGLSLLAVRAVSKIQEPFISGSAGSLAASLDYAISKQPLWLTEMFGCDQAGVSLLRRMILRTNPERKRPGPVILSFNQKFMPLARIVIFSERALCEREQMVTLAAELSRAEELAAQERILRAA